MPKGKKNKKAKVLYFCSRKVEKEAKGDPIVEENEDMSEDCSEDKEIIKEIQKIHKIMAGKRSQPEPSLTKTKQVEKRDKKSKKISTEEEAQRVLEMEESDEDNNQDYEEDNNEDDNGVKHNGSNLSDEAESENQEDSKDYQENDEDQDKEQSQEEQNEEDQSEEEQNEEEQNEEEQSEEEQSNQEEQSEEEEQENSGQEKVKKDNKEEVKKKEKEKKKSKHKPDKKLIVKNLPFTATKKQIAKFFNDLAQVASVKLIERDGKPKGKAFVIFTSPEETNKALKANSKEFQGRKLKVRKLEVFKEQVKEAGLKIFVGGLSANVSEEDIKNFFKDYGKLENIVLTVGNKKGYALVDFKSSEAAKKALELSGQTLNGKKVKIEIAKEKRGKVKN